MSERFDVDASRPSEEAWVAVIECDGGHVFRQRFSIPTSSMEGIEFMWTEGNFACDCNKRLFLLHRDSVDTESLPDDATPCGNTMPTKRIVATRESDGSQVVLLG